MAEESSQQTTNPATEHPNPFPPNPVEVANRQVQVQPARDPTIRAAPLGQLAQANFIRARSILQRHDLVVYPGRRRADNQNPTRFAYFCDALYDYLTGLVIGSHGVEPGIEKDAFVRICQTLLVARVQQIREHRLGERTAVNRVNITRTLNVPAALGEILSGLGEIYLEHHGYSFVPNLPAVAAPIPDYYTVDFAQLRNYIVFMDTLSRQGLHRLVTLPATFEGTPYWILHRQIVTGQATVTGITGEGTPADGLLRAIIDISDAAPGDRGFVYVSNIEYRSLLIAYFSMN